MEEKTRREMMQEAVEQTIRICKEKGVLGDYLEKRGGEAKTIMTNLFDEVNVAQMA